MSDEEYNYSKFDEKEDYIPSAYILSLSFLLLFILYNLSKKK